MDVNCDIPTSGYVFNLNLLLGGYVYFTTFTRHLEYGCNNRERREPDVIKTNVMANTVEELGYFLYVITCQDHFEYWLNKYGWAIVSKEFCLSNMAEWLTPKYCLKTSHKTFWDATLLTDDAKKHSTLQKLRKRILSRDGNACKLCGIKKSDDNPLTMHHIRPFSKAGMTAEHNLLLLCRECNENIGDGYLPRLYELIDRVSYQDEHFWLPFASDMMHARVKLLEN